MRDGEIRPAGVAAPAEARLERANEIAGRFLANIETVVHGKRRRSSSSSRRSPAAATCSSRTCRERPRPCSPARSRQSIEGATPARIQCTPDLQPTDVTGLSVYDQRTRDFEFRPGPIFANVVLVDEINRAMPKTQSALLEAMAERQVTVDGVTRALPEPFLLLATENPIEHEGTFPLPEAQLDRFFLKTALGYPGAERRAADHRRPARRRIRCSALEPVVTVEEVRELQRAVARRLRRPLLVQAGSSTSCAPRARLPGVAIGASVRGSLALERAVRAWALLARPRLRHAGGRRAALPAPCSATASSSRPPCSPRRAGSAGTATFDRFRDDCRASRRRPQSELGGRRRGRSGLSLDDLVFPLVPRRRLVGLAFGAMHSARRGIGSDVAGSRPYRARRRRRHDRLGRVGAALVGARHRRVRRPRALRRRGAARRASSATAGRRWRSAPRELPWLRKYEAMRVAAEIIAESDDAGARLRRLPRLRLRRGAVLAPAASGREHWAIQDRHLAWPDFKAPRDTVERALDFLGVHRRDAPGRNLPLRALRLPRRPVSATRGRGRSSSAGTSFPS